MIVIIKQDYLDFEIYVKNTDNIFLKGSLSSKFFKSKILVYNENNEPKIEIRNSLRLDFWNMTFSIKIPSIQLNSDLKPIRIFKGHWRLKMQKDTYDFILHKGHKKSLFKNNKQIASYDKKFIEILERNSIIIEMNSEENIELVVAIVLCFEMGNKGSIDGISLNVGNINEGIKPYDKNWKAK